MGQLSINVGMYIISAEAVTKQWMIGQPVPITASVV